MQEVVLSQRVFISEIQSLSNCPHAIPQLAPINLNESAQTCLFTNNKEEWRLDSHVDMKILLTIFQCYQIV